MRQSSAARGYGSDHRRHFRRAVLHRDRLCVLCLARGDEVPATDADHYPRSRRQLEALGLDPNDPQHGRGLCHSCHSRETARYQPGGFNANNPRPRPRRRHPGLIGGDG